MAFRMNRGVAGRFRAIRNATRPWLRGGTRPPTSEVTEDARDIRVRGKGRWHRKSANGKNLRTAVVYLLVAAGVLLVVNRLSAAADVEYGVFWLMPFAVVGLIALLTSKLSYPAKLLWSIPLLVVLLALLA